jgi:hypothetical protein
MCPPQLLSSLALIDPGRLESTTTRRANLAQYRYLIDKETSTLIPARSASAAGANVRRTLQRLARQFWDEPAEGQYGASASAERFLGLKEYGLD